MLTLLLGFGIIVKRPQEGRQNDNFLQDAMDLENWTAQREKNGPVNFFGKFNKTCKSIPKQQKSREIWLCRKTYIIR